ncbi:unnamed protein product [Leptosia nina]|uniref:Gustatory receptor n=1 Tax=Leptosia nina TaxID=320188 RepID=A0AAV1JAT6_9NEOP
MLDTNISYFTKFILLLQLLCGYYTTLFKSRKLNVAAQIYALFVLFCVACGVFINAPKEKETYYIVGLVSYHVDYAITFLLTAANRNLLCKFFSSLRALDVDLGLTRNHTTAKTFLLFLLLMVEKCYIGHGYFIHYPEMKFVFKDLSITLAVFSWYVSRVAICINAMVQCIIFEAIWNSMTELAKAFEVVFNRNNKTVCHIKSLDIQRFMIAYDALLDSTNATGPLFKTLVNIYMVAECICQIIMFIYPCIIMELTKREVHKIKLLLNEISAHHTVKQTQRCVRGAEVEIVWDESQDTVVSMRQCTEQLVHLPAYHKCAAFEWNWHSMKKLQIVFEEKILETNRTMASNKRKDIEDILLVYADLHDTLNSFGLVMESLVVWNSVFPLLYILSTVVAAITTDSHLALSRLVVDNVLHMAIFIFPCIMMEMIKSEVDKIRVMLTEIYTESADEGVVRKAEDGLKFLELCPYEFVVLRFIPVNIKLPLKILAVLTSYMIITLQLAYLSG